jgi:hypothetical protein
VEHCFTFARKAAAEACSTRPRLPAAGRWSRHRGGESQAGLCGRLRDYAIGAAVLGGLGVRSVRLMTNNPRKVEALEGLGVTVAERVPLLAGWNQHKRPGLGVSSDKLGCLTEFIPGRLDTLLVTAQRQAVGSLPTASGYAPPVFRQSSD